MIFASPTLPPMDSVARFEVVLPKAVVPGTMPHADWSRNVMPFLVLLLTAIAGVAIWYFRTRGPADAAGDVIDAAGHLKGAYNRRKFRNKVEASTLASIDDPGLAAAVLLVAIADAGSGVDAKHETMISDWLRDTVEYRDPSEALTFAKWAVRDVADVNNVVRRLLPLWKSRLDDAQCRELIAAATRVALVDGGPDHAQADALRRLKEGLNA